LSRSRRSNRSPFSAGTAARLEQVHLNSFFNQFAIAGNVCAPQSRADDVGTAGNLMLFELPFARFDAAHVESRAAKP
jgi:hypothetical protein